MKPDELDSIYRATLDDGRLSRGERQSLKRVLEDLGADRAVLGDARGRAFRIAREALAASSPAAVLEWLEEVVRVLDAHAHEEGKSAQAEALFSPGDACARRIAALVAGARESIEVCVYTITDDRLSGPLLAAHARGVRVRVVTDDEKADDLGSDAEKLRAAGIPVAVDDSPTQMHHKFALFDGRTLVTGSYNWTVSASQQNSENVVITDDARLVTAFAGEFARLWKLYA